MWVSFFICMQFNFLKQPLLTLKKVYFKHIVITKRVFHRATVWSYSLCINENFDLNEDQPISLLIIAITFCTRFLSFCFMTFSYSPYNRFFILSNVFVIIVSTEIPAKSLELYIWGTRSKLVFILTTQINVRRALNQMCSATEKPKSLNCVQK